MSNTTPNSNPIDPASVPPVSSSQPSLQIEARWDKPLVPAAGGAATLMIRIVPTAPAATGRRRAPLDLAIALDRSGSMGGGRLERAKAAADVAVGFLRDDDRVALTVFDHEVQTVQPLAEATPRVKTALRLALRGIDTGGSTALADGWLTACQEIAGGGDIVDSSSSAPNHRPTRIRRALLLTDGHANVGVTDPGELMIHANALRERGIATSTMGVGEGFDEDLLAGMAEAGGGNFHNIADEAELRGVFERELGELLSVVAAGLSLTLTLPPGVRAFPIGSYPVTRDGKRFTISVRDVPANDEIRLVFAISAAPRSLGSAHQIRLEAAWADTLADTQRHTTVAVPPLLYADPATIAGTASDPVVREEAAMRHAAHERREAMRLDRSGRHAESRARLRNAQTTLREMAYSPAALDFLADGDVLLAAPAAAPFSEATRKHTVARAHDAARRRTRAE